MKKLVLLGMVLCSMIGSLTSTSFSDESTIVENEGSHIQKAELINSYIIDLKENIDLFKKKYNIIQHEKLEKEVKEINGIAQILKSIQAGEIDHSTGAELITLIIERLRNSKSTIKEILKKEKQDFERSLERQKANYKKVGEKVSKQLDEIIRQIFKTMKKRGFGKDGIGEREQKIINSLNTLFKHNIKLQNFGKTEFSSEKEMKKKFLKVLKDIKKEMQTLKKTWLSSS